jgi:NADPH2:quinone reductase
MQYGAYAERVVVSQRRALPVIEGFSLEENAAYGVNFLTAWVPLVEMARLRASVGKLVVLSSPRRRP